MFRNSARVYDLMYEASGKDYAAEARDLHDQIKARAPDAVSLLDVACGTGGHLVHLRHWYNVVGLDLDPSMLEVAQGRLPDATLVEADMRTFHLASSFDAVVCLFSSIGYMATAEELYTAVGNMARHLNRGGVLIVDGWVRPDAWRGTVSTHVETAALETVKVARCGLARRDGNKTHLEMHHLIATTNGIDHLVDHHDLTLFESAQYRDAFVRVGLDVEEAQSPIPDRDRYIGIKPRS